jgi:glutathione synthase
MQNLKIGFVIDPIENINPKKDSTIALMNGAQSRDWDIAYFELNNLEVRTNKAFGLCKYIKLNLESKDWYSVDKEIYETLNQFDIIFMRKDPPFNLQYITATYILELAEKEGVLVLNKPSSLRNANEKIFGLNFPNTCPPSILTRSKKSILEFLKEYDKIILKPLDKMGGRSIYMLQENDPNTIVIIEEITKHETEFVMVQKYISDVKKSGDKRILLVNGEPIPFGIARFPQGIDHRANIAVGGKIQGFKLSENDLKLCSEIKDELKNQNLFFVGIDVIGNYITEINVTSPTGIKEISETSEIDVTTTILDSLELIFKSHKINLNENH